MGRLHICSVRRTSPSFLFSRQSLLCPSAPHPFSPSYTSNSQLPCTTLPLPTLHLPPPKPQTRANFSSARGKGCSDPKSGQPGKGEGVKGMKGRGGNLENFQLSIRGRSEGISAFIQVGVWKRLFLVLVQQLYLLPLSRLSVRTYLHL